MDYTFSTTNQTISGYSPLVLNIIPTSLDLGLTSNEFISKIVYQFPDGTVTKSNSFVSSGYDESDCRATFQYTVPASVTPQTITITVYIGPDQFSSPTTYTIVACNLLPFLTTNPLVTSPSAHAFQEVHLVKTTVWGATNSQIVALETKNPNYLLVNFSA
jgi:hypothetical protein